MLIGLLNFSRPLSTKCVFLQSGARPTLIDLNSVGLNFYPFLISLDRFNGTCSTVDDLLVKICAPNKTKDVNVKVFNMVTRINESNALLKHFMQL